LKISTWIENHDAKTPSCHLISISTIKIGADPWHIILPNPCSCNPFSVGQQTFSWIVLSINGVMYEREGGKEEKQDGAVGGNRRGQGIYDRELRSCFGCMQGQERKPPDYFSPG
jgi:hypothetical protein